MVKLMKNHVLFLSAFLIGSAVGFEVPLLKEQRPPRMVKFSNPERITAEKIEIVVVKNASGVVRFAAKELQTFLTRRLGGKIAVTENPTPGKRSLILGISQLTRKAGIDTGKLCRDSFFIRSAGEDVYIAGKDDPAADPAKALKGNKYSQNFERGTLFGVYDFLERFAGVRFYFPGKYGVVVPKDEMFLPRQIDIFDRPDLEVRVSGLEESVFTESPSVISRPYVDRNNFATHRGQISPLKFLSGYRFRFSSMQLPNCHGLNFLQLGKRFAADKPDFFALDANGKRYTDPNRPHPFQLCYSSGVREIILEDIEAYFRGKTPASRGIRSKLYGKPIDFWHPHGFSEGVADMQPQDSFFQCRCKKCSHIKSKKAVSDLIWDLAIDAAENLKKKKLPGMIQLMSYYPYNLLPDRKIPNNFIVLLAVGGPWRMNFNAKMQAQDKLVEKWSEKSNRSLILWNYCGKYGSLVMPDIPHHTPRHIGHYYKRIAPYICGAKLLLSGDYYMFAAMNYYMFAKVTWDLSTDPESLLEEYYRLMFGAGAGEMKKIFESLEDAWIKANGRIVDTPLGPAGVAASQYELFEIFYSPEFLKNMEMQFVRAENLTTSDPESTERIKFMRWNFLERLRRASDEYFTQASAPRHFNGKGSVFATEKTQWEKVRPLYLQRLDGKEKYESSFKAVLTPEFLKFRIECYEPAPQKVTASPLDPPSSLWDRNGIELFINPSCDRKNYYHLMLSSAKVQLLAAYKMTGRNYMPSQAKLPGMTASVTTLPGKFIYEIAFKRGDLPGFDGKQLVCNVIRNQKKKDFSARYSWSPFLGKGNHDLLNSGILKFLSAPAHDLLRDGDFTGPQKGRNVFGDWITNWNIPAGCSIAHDDSTFISGFRSLRITSSPDIKWFQISNTVDLEPGTRYRLSYFVKLSNVKGNERESGFCVNLWSDRNRWFPATKLTGTTPWIRQSFEFTTASDEKRRFKIKPFMHSCSGSVNIDCISLEKIGKKR